MSKRNMEFQGGGERYGEASQQENGGDAPRTATAAQMARRKIASLKGRPGSQRGSRQASPAVGPVNAFNPQQTFQPPQAGSFDFAFGNVNNTPAFGQQPAAPSQPQNGGFSFGASTPAQPNMPAQPNGSGMFGSQSTNSTASFGAANNTQSQQNGFAPSTSSIFSTQTPASTAPTNPFSFGQSQPEQSVQMNGAVSTTSTSFGAQVNGSNGYSFGSSKSAIEENRGTTPSFTGFGATTSVQKETTPAFSSFGASQSVAQTPKPATSAFGFGAQPSTQPAATQSTPSIFTGFGKTAEKPAEANGQKPKPIFSFGASAAPAEPGPVQPGQSIFSGVAKPTIKAGMFSQSATNGDATPKPANSFNFTSSTNTAATPAPSNMFNFSHSAQTATPKAPTNSFQGFGQPQSKEAPTIKFSAAEDTSMQSPDSTPKKPSQNQAQAPASIFSAFSSTPNAAASANQQADSTEPPAPKQKSMWERMEKSAESSATPSQDHRPAPPQTEKIISKHSEYPAPPSTAPRSSTSLFPASRSNAPSTFKPAGVPVTSKPPTSSTSSISASSSAQQKAIRTLNTSFLRALTNASLSVDWSPLLSSYLTHAENIRQQKAATAAKSSTSKPVDFDATPKAPAFTNIFQNQTPANNLFKSAQPPATAPVSKKRPAEEHLTKSGEAPATEKRVRAEEPIEYPKLSETASKSAKLFESVLDKSTSSTPKFGPPDAVVNKVREEAAKKADGSKPAVFTPSTNSLFSSGSTSATSHIEQTSSTTNKATFGFTPSASSTAGKSSQVSGAAAAAAAKPADAPKFGFIPSTSSSTTAAPPSGMPTFSAPAPGAGGFLSAFGKKAEATAEQEKKKRKAEDYDSDEDDEATWEAKYEAEQREKRQKIEEAAKTSSAFGFKPTATASTTKTSTSAFGFGLPKSTAADAAPKKVSAEQLEKQTGTGDKTWQPKTPIKFGNSVNAPDSTTPQAAPPATSFGGLFGSGTPSQAASKAEPAKLAPPTVGFSFGPKTASQDVSRATTPAGAATDGESPTAADGEPSDTLNDKQLEDMTALLPEERDDNDVLFSVGVCKASKFMSKTSEDGKSVMAWVERGKGPLYILRNKQTGSTSVLLKVPPLGKVAMNFRLVGGSAEYRLAQGRTKHVTGPFVDYLDTDVATSKKPSSWLMQVAKPEDAKEMARLMQENKPSE